MLPIGMAEAKAAAEAIIAANSDGFSPYNTALKQRVVIAMLNDPVLRQGSDRFIAKLAGVGSQMVRRHRAKLDPTDAPSQRLGNDGRWQSGTKRLRSDRPTSPDADPDLQAIRQVRK